MHLKNIMMRDIKIFTPNEVSFFLNKLPKKYKHLCNMMLHTGLGMKEAIAIGYSLDTWFLPDELTIYYNPKRWDSDPRQKRRIVYLAPADVKFVKKFGITWKKYVSQQTMKHKTYSHTKIYTSLVDMLSKALLYYAKKYSDAPETVRPASFMATRIAWLATAYPEHIDTIYESTRNTWIGITKQDIIDFVNASPFTDGDIKKIISQLYGWKVSEVTGNTTTNHI
jgi:hypothetical protein